MTTAEEYLRINPRLLAGALSADDCSLLRQEAEAFRLEPHYPPRNLLRVEGDASGSGQPKKRLAKAFSPYLYLRHPHILAKLTKASQEVVPDDFSPAFDILFNLAPGDPGLRWHVALESLRFVKGDRRMLTLWVPLDPLNDETGGRLEVFGDAVISHGLGLLFCDLVERDLAAGPTAPDGAGEVADKMLTFYRIAGQFLEKKAVRFDHQAGDALLFADTCLHRSEPVKRPDFTRVAYALRFLQNDIVFDMDVVRDMHARLGHHLYGILRKHDLTTFAAYREFVKTHPEAVLASHPLVTKRAGAAVDQPTP